jgi:hypothetical protein
VVGFGGVALELGDAPDGAGVGVAPAFGAEVGGGAWLGVALDALVDGAGSTARALIAENRVLAATPTPKTETNRLTDVISVRLSAARAPLSISELLAAGRAGGVE